MIVEDMEGDSYLVISDIHIGFEDQMNKNGVLFDPRKNMEEILDLLTRVVTQTKIRNLIILGDLKSSIKVITKAEWIHVPYFIERVLGLVDQVYLVPGNHDGNIRHLVSREVNLMSVKGMEIKGILFTHGHAASEIGDNIYKIITGHLHPTITSGENITSGQQAWVRIILNKKNKNLNNTRGGSSVDSGDKKVDFIIMPHFNRYLSYNSGFDRYMKRKKTKLPLLNNLLKEKKWNIETVYVISLDGAIVGAEHELDKMIN
ncbi:MAG: metallophosphoesterase [Thermoproteota archaeon]|nr:metallophosphoesterase [Thermoproteota archaeon]